MSDHPREALSALLDGELRDAERRAVEAHLASCASCARHLRELTALDAMARGLPPVAAPEDYYEALPGRVRRRLGARRATLEVRASNHEAQRLYSRLGFAPAGVRRRYYSNPVEDAVILWREDVHH